MNKEKQVINKPKLRDETKISLSTSNIIPAGRDFNKEDKKYWVEKLRRGD